MGEDRLSRFAWAWRVLKCEDASSPPPPPSSSPSGICSTWMLMSSLLLSPCLFMPHLQVLVGSRLIPICCECRPRVTRSASLCRPLSSRCTASPLLRPVPVCWAGQLSHTAPPMPGGLQLLYPGTSVSPAGSSAAHPGPPLTCILQTFADCHRSLMPEEAEIGRADGAEAAQSLLGTLERLQSTFTRLLRWSLM